VDLYSTQCQLVAESETLGWAARGSRRPTGTGSSEF